ncbi:MAG: hypothetical protein U9Q85_01025, partial [Patescibacteria group bacterium]|nr:hypothetical protein [Patescibacteria group bacterium]
KVKFILDQLAYFRIWSESKTVKEKGKFKEEENRIRKKYGGSVINPGAIHRWRYRQKWLRRIKEKFPGFYYLVKRAIYKTINLFKNG